MLNVNDFRDVTKVINEFKHKQFNYDILIDELEYRRRIYVKKYKIIKYFRFLKKWNFIKNVGGRQPFVLTNKIPINMVHYMCTFTDLNEQEREELKNFYFRSEKLKTIKSNF